MYIVFVIENVYTKEFEPYGYEGTLNDLPEMVEEAKWAEGGVMAPEWKHVETHEYRDEAQALKKWGQVHRI